MQKLNAAVKKFVADESGLTIVEYAVAGALITVAVVVAFGDLGDAVGLTIGDMQDAVEGNAGG